MYFGVYCCTLGKGRIFIPARLVSQNDLTTWRIVLTARGEREEKRILLSDEENWVEDGETRVLEEGRISLSARRTWKLPKSVLSLLACEECALVGCMRYIELMPADAYDPMRDMEEIETVKERLTLLGL
jgi:hypothetical protein